jgi:hypothetical protein
MGQDPQAPVSWWGALRAVPWMVLERLVSLEVQLVKLLISNRDM